MAVTMDRTVTDVDRNPTPPFARDASDVVAAMGSDPSSGLTATEASARLASNGPNAIAGEVPPSAWAIAAQNHPETDRS